METKKLNNLFKLIKTSIEFNNFLNHEFLVPNHPQTTNELRSTNISDYKDIIATHAILILAIFKEMIIKKNSEDLNLSITEQAFQTLMGNLIQEDGTKYKLGSLTFEEKVEILELLRNKLLHGDYYIDDNTIILNKQGITGTITIGDLIQMSNYLLVIEKFDLRSPNVRQMLMGNKNELDEPNNMETLEDLKEFTSKLFYIKFTDHPEEGYSRTNEYALVLDQFYSTISQTKKRYLNKDIEEIYPMIKAYFSPAIEELHMNITMEKIPISTIENYEMIEKAFLSAKKPLLNRINSVQRKETTIRLINSIVMSKDNDEMIVARALSNNIQLLLMLLTNQDIYDRTQYYQSQSLAYLDEMTIAALFNTFYCLYHYGLDEIYSKQGKTTLKDIASGECMNFAKLDLSLYEDKDMTTDISFGDFESQLEALERNVEKTKNNVSSAKQALDNYKKKAKSPTPEAEQRIKDRLDKALDEYEQAKRIYKEAKRFMKKDYKKHIENFNIICHIRNSFAHGNVRILPFTEGDILKDAKIVMQDIYQGKLTYYLKIRFDDLFQILSEQNGKIIFDFVNSKLKNIGSKEELAIIKRKNNLTFKK